MSSLNASRRVGRPVSSWYARLTHDVRATSPNVPICGSPDGPYPVSNSASRPSPARRPARRAASSKGQALGTAFGRTGGASRRIAGTGAGWVSDITAR